jgi:hypothetical protein
MPIAPPVLIAPSGEVAEPKNFADSPVAGQYLQIDAGARTWRWGAGGITSTSVPVAQTLFVDAINFSATATGNFGSPFRTIQQAITQAVTNGWTAVQIMAAPATYADPIAIPLALELVIIQGWGPPTFLVGTIIGGDITYASIAGGWANLHLRDVNVTAANITVLNPGEDLYVSLENCECAAAIAAFNLDLALWDTNQTGAATAGGGLSVEFDGYSWARHVQATPPFTAVGIYGRNFFDAGHDTYQTALTSLAVPVFPAAGSTVFETFAVPLVTEQDHVSTIAISPAATDFIIGGHTCTAGNVTIWLTNLSRVAGNFADDIELLIHHHGMQEE